MFHFYIKFLQRMSTPETFSDPQSSTTKQLPNQNFFTEERHKILIEQCSEISSKMSKRMLLDGFKQVSDVLEESSFPQFRGVDAE